MMYVKLRTFIGGSIMSVAKSWYIGEGNAERLEALSEKIGVSESKIVDGLISGALPVLEKKAPKERAFNLNVDIKF